MTKRTFFFGLLVAATVSAFSACGGGGGSSAGLTPGAPSRPGSPQKATTGAQIHVVIPQKASSSSVVRRPNFISPSTASFQVIITQVNGVAPNPAPTPMVVVIATSPFCTGQGTSSVSCTIIVQVPIATSVQLELESFDASGNLLGKAQIGPLNTTLPTIPTQNISVGGVPATVSISPAALSAADDGATHTVTFNVSAQDASGNTIVQPGSYPNSINLTVAGDPNASLSLSATAIGSPGPNNGATTVTLSYNSAKALTAAATITATSGTNTATTTFAPLVVTPTALPSLLTNGSAQTLTVSEPGYTGAFTITGPTTANLVKVTCSTTGCVQPSTSGSVTVTLTPESIGATDKLSIADANGTSFTIPIIVTGGGGGGTAVGGPPTIYRYATATGGKNYGITTGPDGQSIWYVDQPNSSVGAIASASGCATTCTVNEMPVPSMPTTPPLPTTLTQIVTANDGNMYALDNGNGTTDLGALVQLTGCVATSAACLGLGYPEATFFSSFGSPAAMALDPFGDIYLSANGSTYGGSIIWQAVNGCCFTGNRNITIGSTPVALGGIAFDGSGDTWFLDTGKNTVGFVFNEENGTSAPPYIEGSPGPCALTCYAFESDATVAGPFGLGIAHRDPTPPLRAVQRKLSTVRRNVLPPGGSNTYTGPLTDMILGPDGNLYVADQHAHSIDIINPATWMASPPCTATSCTYTSIKISTTAEPQNMVVGPDGNIWFTDITGFVGEVLLSTCATTCTVKEYPVTGTPWGITAGPDGDIWFTDSSTNSIGKVVLQ